ncbi:MAG: 60S ribosomal protein L20 [Aureobasidium pullulans]|nr:MAG: 60S ribosomal protein L20 [Aureobasidium pullulans]
MPTMLATILSSAVASLAAALRFLADGLAAIAYANNVSRSTIPATLLYIYTKYRSGSTIPISSSRLPAPV